MCHVKETDESSSCHRHSVALRTFTFGEMKANQLPPPFTKVSTSTHMNPGVDKAMRGRRNDVVEAMLGAIFD